MLVSLLVISSASTVMTLMLLWRLVSEIQNSITAKHWVSTQGVISDSRLATVRIARQGGHSSGATFLPQITYQFEYGGRVFEGTRISFGESRIAGSSKRALEVCDIYPKGKSVTVYFDRGNPNKSVLNPFETRGMYLTGFILICLAFVSCLFWTCYFFLG